MAYFIWRKRRRHCDSNHGNYTPVVQKLQITDTYLDLLECVNGALMKHYRRLHDLIDPKSTPRPDSEIINENRAALFDADKMLAEWRQSKKSTYLHYIEVLKVAISREDESDHAWPPDEVLRWISCHLNQGSMDEICKELKITCKIEDYSDNDDEEKWYHSLREWRNKVAHENVEIKQYQLSSVIRSKKVRGLPPLKGRFIYKAELVDMAFNLLMQDLLPVTEALGINVTKSVSYRPAFDPSHLKLGTIGLLSKLLKSVDRGEGPEKGDVRDLFFSKIGIIAYRDVATCGMIAYDMSYGELYAIKEAMASVQEKANVIQDSTSQAATHSEDGKSEKGASSKIHEGENNEEASTKNPEWETPHVVPSRDQPEPGKAVKDIETTDQRTGIRVVDIPEDLVDLQHVLQLTDQDIAGGLGSSQPITAYALCRIWKEKPRSSVFNYRAALAHELRRIQMPDLADEVIAGKYIKEQKSREFIKNMVQGMSQEQLRSLEKLLKLSGKGEQRHTSTSVDEIMSEQIYKWAADWTKEMRDRVKALDTSSFKFMSTVKKHRDLNDKLVEHGFLDLAREIMIIEQ